jgi:hypothetical protein
MAEVCVAAGPDEAARAKGLASALAMCGFDAFAAAPTEADLAKTADDAKCVLVLWSREAPPPWLAVLATLALDRKKLVSLELQRGSAPAPFHAGPRFELAARDRAAFKTQFGALTAEIGKLAPAKGDAAAPPPDALAAARAALLASAQQAEQPRWATLGAFALAVGLLFLVGFGAGRLLGAMRSGDLLLVTTRANATAPAASPAAAPAAVDAAGGPFGVTPADLESTPWRDAAARIDAGAAARIAAAARQGDAFAQALACLGHLSGAEGFLPSPTAARAQCDAAAAQDEAAGLYLSWVLRRNAPHAGIDEATARGRLADAARMGWTAAQVDYALVLAPDARAAVSAQAEAGRLWLAAAEAGDPRGQFYYARWLRDSAAGPRDPTAAVPFLERAAQSGQLDAIHMLATFYRDGIGATRDPERARTLYEQAARQEHPPSMFNLADMLRSGSSEERARAVALYQQLVCLNDERQIQALAVQRLRALRESASCR